MPTKVTAVIFLLKFFVFYWKGVRISRGVVRAVMSLLMVTDCATGVVDVIVALVMLE
jgi:hypothetical protein